MVLLFVLVLGVSTLEPVHAQTQPSIRLTAINYPQTVLPGSTFRVKIDAWYSGSFLSDIGVWDVGLGLMVQSMTFISQFNGPGNVSFTLSLIAPAEATAWHLLAINRVWWQNAWYQDPKGGALPFTVVVSSNITLTLGTLGAGARIGVDGYPYDIRNGSYVSLSLESGMHTLAAPMSIEPTAGLRYVFVGWSDGVNSSFHKIFLTTSTTIYALYRTEFYLSIQSDNGQVAGGGWYPAGAEATVAAPLTAEVDQFGYSDDYRFAGWSGASNSESNGLTLIMDGPKEITANWVNAGNTIDSNVVTAAVLLACLPLLYRLVKPGRKNKRSPSRTVRAPKHAALILMLAMLVLPAVYPVAHAQSLPRPGASVVRIGDAQWYYWSHTGSDTCLIWLGGGVPEQTEPGAYAYFINPFDYESFDTIRFIQDLTNYYCVIALQQGSAPWLSTGANRTIYQELFQPESSVLELVHAWVEGQGYAHTFVVGYSVGGQAAIADLTLSHPNNWTADDGIILITVPFGRDVINNAHELRTNLFIIYGGNLPDYETSGMQFYNDTQTEGLRANGYFHKEFHVIEDVGHEVWTIRATGAYDRRALNLMIAFIEKSKTLQVERSLRLPPSNSTAGTAADVLAVLSPSAVNPGEAFVIQSTVKLSEPSTKSMILVVYSPNEANVLNDAFLPEGTTSVNSIVPAIPKAMNLTLTIAVFQNANGNWIQASNVYSTITSVTNSTTLTIETFPPGVSFLFDGTQYSSNPNGLAKIETSTGQHLIQVQPFIYLGNGSRLRFIGWEDATNETSRQLNLNGNESIALIYVPQYLIQVTSTYGETNGSAWYDANSTASALVQPPMLNTPPLIFSHWTAYGNQSQTRISFAVTAPEEISAVWAPANMVLPAAQIVLDPILVLSVLAFIVLATLNVITYQRRGRC